MTRGPARGGRISWIAGSFAERDEALGLLQDDGLGEPRDELGIGPLRDVFANAFFPGVTTLQTRAKYFVLVPAMYARIENDPTLRKRPENSIGALEETLLTDLRRRGQSAGVIGSQQWRVPNTPSSAIYWTGLHTWRIRRFSDSRSRYHAWLQTPGRLLRVESVEEDAIEDQRRWVEVPGGESALDKPSIDLTRAEAEFLESSILTIPTAHGTSLLRQLLDEPARSGPFWTAPLVRRGRAHLAGEARDAEMLSTAHHGAMLLYNLLCARQLKSSDAVTAWAARCDSWSLENPRDRWVEWDLDGMWERVLRLRDGRRAVENTKPFVDGWVGALRALGRSGLRDSRDAQRTLEAREHRTKPGRERLTWPHALQGWTSAGVGVEPLDYRWHRASRILQDIQEGRER